MEPHTKMREECPFCHEQVLDVLWWPSHKAAHASRSAVAKSTTWSRKPERHELLSEKCPNCGKTASDIEKSLKACEGRLSKLPREKREVIEDLMSLTNATMKLHYFLHSKDKFQDAQRVFEHGLDMAGIVRKENPDIDELIQEIVIFSVHALKALERDRLDS